MQVSTNQNASQLALAAAFDCRREARASLFLDFDGVLHPEHCHESKHFSSLSQSERVLREVPDVQPIISSTWRLHRSLDELKSRFSVDTAAKIAGQRPAFSILEDITCHLAPCQREVECLAWLKAFSTPWMPWLAVDDYSWLPQPFCTQLFVMDGLTGLDEVSGEMLLTRLCRQE